MVSEKKTFQVFICGEKGKFSAQHYFVRIITVIFNKLLMAKGKPIVTQKCLTSASSNNIRQKCLTNAFTSTGKVTVSINVSGKGQV